MATIVFGTKLFIVPPVIVCIAAPFGADDLPQAVLQLLLQWLFQSSTCAVNYGPRCTSVPVLGNSLLHHCLMQDNLGWLLAGENVSSSILFLKHPLENILVISRISLRPGRVDRDSNTIKLSLWRLLFTRERLLTNCLWLRLHTVNCLLRKSVVQRASADFQDTV